MHHIPKRSLGGCLTCRKRKKKCDETRPNCQRCIKGDFHCLGYGLLETSGNPNESSLDQSSVQRGTSAPHLDREFHLSDLSLSSIRSSNPQPIGTAPRNTSNFQTTPAFITIPQAPMLQLDLSTIHEILPLVVSQYAAASRHMFFKPLPFSIEDGLRWRVQISEVTRWSMYLVARILEDMSSGNNGQRYISWITHFYQKIIGSSASSELVKHLNPHLAGLHDLAGCVVMISGSSAGYSFFKTATPLFLQLAARSPELWSNDGAISISGALRSNLHEIKSFVLHDTITALAHGIPPLLCYDTSSPWAEDTQHPRLEWVYGIPAGIIMSLAKINSWRVSRVLDQVVSNGTERRIIEDCLLGWTPTVDQTSETVEDVARLAVLECWRHAALIFLYMGMYDVNSADPRVEAGVRQVTQLASTVPADNPLESHLLIPCLIAGAAARREKQRAVLRKKVGVFRLAPSLMLRGTDFLAVLDHLWHGAASGGRPTTWDDYVQSRYIALPIST